MNTCYYLEDLGEERDSFSDRRYRVMVRIQAADIQLTWILCCLEDYKFAKYLVNRLNSLGGA